MSITVQIDTTSTATTAASLRRSVEQAKAASVTIADLRAIARTLTDADDAPAALICRAAHATRDHLSAAPLGGSLRALRWPDASVTECVAAVGEALRALGAAE